mmetsp:Transcript_20900/g.51243  ORF Transcript_20900/g.51243 Transcript_20900/m.51243 type:complete len:272 (-) Transcript_20900:361-1176(-)
MQAREELENLPCTLARAVALVRKLHGILSRPPRQVPTLGLARGHSVLHVLPPEDLEDESQRVLLPGGQAPRAIVDVRPLPAERPPVREGLAGAALEHVAEIRVLERVEEFQGRGLHRGRDAAGDAGEVAGAQGLRDLLQVVPIHATVVVVVVIVVVAVLRFHLVLLIFQGSVRAAVGEVGSGGGGAGDECVDGGLGGGRRRRRGGLVLLVKDVVLNLVDLGFRLFELLRLLGVQMSLLQVSQSVEDDLARFECCGLRPTLGAAGGLEDAGR